MKPADALRPTSRRIEDFSDAVFAIVVTIMVFDMRIPDVLASGWDWAAFKPFAIVLLTYALSFFVVANLWTSHHYLVSTLHNPTRTTIWRNNLVLFFATLIPVVTRFLGLHPDSPTAAAAYGLEGVAITLAFMLLRTHAARTAHSEVHRQIHRRVIRITWLFLAIYAAAIPLAFVSPWLAWACFLAVPPMVFLLPSITARHSPVADPAEHAIERSCP
jgi:uncharacterized membrane protein